MGLTYPEYVQTSKKWHGLHIRKNRTQGLYALAEMSRSPIAKCCLATDIQEPLTMAMATVDVLSKMCALNREGN